MKQFVYEDLSHIRTSQEAFHWEWLLERPLTLLFLGCLFLSGILLTTLSTGPHVQSCPNLGGNIFGKLQYTTLLFAWFLRDDMSEQHTISVYYRANVRIWFVTTVQPVGEETICLIQGLCIIQGAGQLKYKGPQTPEMDINCLFFISNLIWHASKL